MDDPRRGDPMEEITMTHSCAFLALGMKEPSYELAKLQKARILGLNEDILEITILNTNTPYPSRKIRRRGIKLNTPYPEDQYAVLEIWNEYNILEDIKCGLYSKKSSIRHIQSLDTPYRTDFQTL
ncbi:hypothetical protein Tco_1116595 [Tanacetum coccineum]